MALSLTRSVHGLAHSLRSLPRGTVENLKYVFTLLLHFTGGNAFLVVTRNTPLLDYQHVSLVYLIAFSRDCRQMALSIVQQLVLSPGGDDDMGTLLGEFENF